MVNDKSLNKSNNQSQRETDDRDASKISTEASRTHLGREGKNPATVAAATTTISSYRKLKDDYRASRVHQKRTAANPGSSVATGGLSMRRRGGGGEDVDVNPGVGGVEAGVEEGSQKEGGGAGRVPIVIWRRRARGKRAGPVENQNDQGLTWHGIFLISLPLEGTNGALQFHHNALATDQAQ
ncbi:hypothetical protein NM208_g13533 [Fusarium decemcellulare]|uniref:Uncharacterized protein n=1 Tax=Fusarium decemcellulare TaxID=57161 RepID=A0ACC1RM15_9HYPO|nr:hypothetical protein NM208_g13533 [Fusarium decemcellulare]